MSFPLNSINSGAIINDNFVALTGAQSVGGTKTYTSQAIYNNNIRLELGYMNHFITSTSANNVMNHTISVSLLQNLDLQKH